MPEPEAAAPPAANAQAAAVPPTPPTETSSSRASFTSCPPEEERESLGSRTARPDGDTNARSPRRREVDHSRGASEGNTDRDGDVRIEDVRQEPTPEPEGQARAGAQRESESREKGEHVEDVGMSGGSGVASPEAQGAEEGRIAQSAEADGATKAAEDTDNAPLYLSYQSPIEREKVHPQAWSSFLHPGSKFHGTQQSDRQVYDVQVEIKDVDLTESRLCGYLRIQGLTDDHPTLTTFFEGEIIGPKHLFRTTHPSWNSSEKIDLQHWARFPAFRPLARAARSSPSTFTLKDYLDREHLFMRWKEYFLVPDHRVKSISGASFEGFYYICFDQVGGGVSGIYFHAKSEKYQQLELRHVGNGGCVGAVEFR